MNDNDKQLVATLRRYHHNTAANRFEMLVGECNAIDSRHCQSLFAIIDALGWTSETATPDDGAKIAAGVRSLSQSLADTRAKLAASMQRAFDLDAEVLELRAAMARLITDDEESA